MHGACERHGVGWLNSDVVGQFLPSILRVGPPHAIRVIFVRIGFAPKVSEQDVVEAICTICSEVNPDPTQLRPIEVTRVGVPRSNRLIVRGAINLRSGRSHLTTALEPLPGSIASGVLYSGMWGLRLPADQDIVLGVASRKYSGSWEALCVFASSSTRLIK